MEIFKSSRFLSILAIGVLQAFVLFNVITSEQGEGLILILQSIIGGAIVIRTVDRGGDKAIESAKIESGMSVKERKEYDKEIKS